MLLVVLLPCRLVWRTVVAVPTAPLLCWAFLRAAPEWFAVMQGDLAHTVCAAVLTLPPVAAVVAVLQGGLVFANSICQQGVPVHR